MDKLRNFFTSKNLFYCLIVVLMLPACGGTKKVPKTTSDNGRTKVYNPATGRYEYETDVTGKVDTVKWTEADPSKVPPIVSDPTQYKDKTTNNEGANNSDSNPNGTGVFGSYNVAIMMPFQADQTNTLEGGISESSLPAIHFYEGVKIALDELMNEGVSLSVSVMDTKRSETNTEYLLNRSDVQSAHLIIGPYSKKPLMKVAEFAKEKKKILVSPTNTSPTITADNPWYIQTNPSLISHCDAIMEHALKHHNPEEIVLVVRNKKAETNRLKYFQDANKVIQSNSFAPKLNEFIIDAETAGQFQEIDLTPYMENKTKVVFIVPSYSNENFISSFLRQVAVAKGYVPGIEVVVYGMPRWMEYERISYDYFENLKVHLSSANYADKENFEVKDFRKTFYERYGAIPTEKAFAGYDMIKYFGMQLKKSGMKFKDKIEMEPYNGLSTKYSFENNISAANATGENFSKVNYIENKHVNILKFENYIFKVVN